MKKLFEKLCYCHWLACCILWF